MLVIAWGLRELDFWKAGRGGPGFGDENHLNSFWGTTTYGNLFGPCPLAGIFIGVGKLVEKPYFATALSAPKLCGHCGLGRVDVGVVSFWGVRETLGYVVCIQRRSGIKSWRDRHLAVGDCKIIVEPTKARNTILWVRLNGIFFIVDLDGASSLVGSIENVGFVPNLQAVSTAKVVEDAASSVPGTGSKVARDKILFPSDGDS